MLRGGVPASGFYSEFYVISSSSSWNGLGGKMPFSSRRFLVGRSRDPFSSHLCVSLLAGECWLMVSSRVNFVKGLLPYQDQDGVLQV